MSDQQKATDALLAVLVEEMGVGGLPPARQGCVHGGGMGTFVLLERQAYLL